MEIQLDNERKNINVKKITIYIENKEFTIQINKFSELIINKENYDIGNSSIIIKPRVSNEISII